jgi:predicted ATPase/class 3 adenylate cyclase
MDVPEPPRGTVTFLFTDVERSTRLLRELGAERYAEARAEHDRLVRGALAAHRGHEVGTEGDAFFAAFGSAADAVTAAVDAQRALAEHSWPEGQEVRVRIGLHSGEPLITPDGYAGIAVHRAARIATAAHGGQIVISATTGELVRDQLSKHVLLRDLGEHRLRDLGRPERLFQVVVAGLADEFPPLRTLEGRPTNLPAQATPLIGRRHELQELAALLRRPGHRLVTLTGPGGTGKTRLALQTAADAVDKFRDGVFFVGLEGLTDPQLLVGTITRTLGVAQRGELMLEQRLMDFLGDKELLLVLDNFEQVVEAAPLLSSLLASAQQLRILVTSVTPLRLSAETEYPVAPLTLGMAVDGGEPVGSDAVALFVERARAVHPQFELTPENASAVAEICAGVDGLPLAIELAAARTRVLSPQALLARLDQRLSLLTGGARDAPERHQALRATIDWSYRLLTQPGQRLFARLSVFAGGCTLAAVEAVCRPHDELGLAALDGIDRLVQTSLVRSEEQPGGEPRFAMLETLREYARERLEESGEGETIRGRHAEFFVGDPQDSEQYWPPQESSEPIQRINIEIENIRAALDWARETSSPLELRLAVLYQRADAVFPAEGRARLERALTNGLPQPPRLRARALAAAGGLSRLRGEYKTARRYTEESLRLYRESGYELGESVALRELELVAVESGDEQEALRLADRSEELARRSADPLALGDVLTRRGMRALETGDTRRARELLDESLVLFRAAGGVYWEGDTRLALAIVEILEGDLEKAAAEAEASLEPFSERGKDWVGKWDTVDVLAAVLGAGGELETGVRLYAAVSRQRETRGEQTPRVLQSVREQTHGRLEDALTSPEYAAAAAEGRRMNLHEAITTALTAARGIAPRAGSP